MIYIGQKYVLIQKKKAGRTVSADYFEGVEVSHNGCFSVRIMESSLYYIINWDSGEAKIVDTTEMPSSSYPWYGNRIIADDVVSIIDTGVLEKWPQNLLDWLTKRM